MANIKAKTFSDHCQQLRWRAASSILTQCMTRSITYRVVGDCKTDRSAKPVPLDSSMVAAPAPGRGQNSKKLHSIPERRCVCRDGSFVRQFVLTTLVLKAEATVQNWSDLTRKAL